MKKLKKILLIVLLIIVGLLIVAALMFYIRFNRATKAMTPAETGALNDSVWCIKDKFVNAFVFKGKNSYLMVDAGFSKKGFAGELAKIGISPDQITTILLTHTDSDHTGAMSLFKNPAVYMERDEEQMINGKNGKMKFVRLKWKYGPYTLLDNNDTLNIDGLKIRIIHTPGHTPGSACYIIGNDYLLSGDNLTVKDGKYGQFIEMFNMDTPTQLESLKQLPEPGTFKYILTGHNGVVRN
jgi:hydroxyacylglutathione hydrolase